MSKSSYICRRCWHDVGQSAVMDPRGNTGGNHPGPMHPECARAELIDMQKERKKKKILLEEAAPDLLKALQPVVDEIENKLPTSLEASYNSDYHFDITLSVAECQAIIAAVVKAKGEKL